MKLVTATISGKKYALKNCAGISSVKGLMFNDMSGIDGALIYGNSIWMPFVKKPLKLVFIDEKMTVVAVHTASPIGLAPDTWKTYWEPKAAYCVELKNTAVKVKPGTKIILDKKAM